MFIGILDKVEKIINKQIESCIENDCDAVICIKELKQKIIELDKQEKERIENEK